MGDGAGRGSWLSSLLRGELHVLSAWLGSSPPPVLSWGPPTQSLALQALRALVLPMRVVGVRSLGLGASQAAQDRTSWHCSCESACGSLQEGRGHRAQPGQRLPAPI